MFTRKLGAAIIAHAAAGSTSLRQVLAGSIQEIARLHPECDLTRAGTPSAAVAILRLDSEQLRYLVLGDVTVVLDIDGEITTISDQRRSASTARERAEVDRYPIGSHEKTAALIGMKHAELAARNTQGGYWIAAADSTVTKHAITGKVPTSAVKQLAMLTDGVARYVDLFRIADWAAVLKVLRRSGPRWFVEKLVRPIEAADPQGVRYPRNRCSDDATVVFIELTGVTDTVDRHRI